LPRACSFGCFGRSEIGVLRFRSAVRVCPVLLSADAALWRRSNFCIPQLSLDFIERSVRSPTHKRTVTCGFFGLSGHVHVRFNDVVVDRGDRQGRAAEAFRLARGDGRRHRQSQIVHPVFPCGGGPVAPVLCKVRFGAAGQVVPACGLEGGAGLFERGRGGAWAAPARPVRAALVAAAPLRMGASGEAVKQIQLAPEGAWLSLTGSVKKHNGVQTCDPSLCRNQPKATRCRKV